MNVKRVTITKTGDYPARYIRGQEVDKLAYVKIGDKGKIKEEDTRGALIWLDKELETLVWIPKTNYR